MTGPIKQTQYFNETQNFLKVKSALNITGECLIFYEIETITI